LPVVKEIKQDIKAAKLTHDLINDLHADVVPYKKTSEGFDVGRFETLMRDKLVEDHINSQSYDRPYISVTELLSCLRQKYYTRMKYDIDVEQQYGFSYLYLINQVGNTVHSLIQNLYDHTETEKTVVSEKFKVKGRVDGIKDNFLLEYKTIDDSKFQGKYIQRDHNQGIIYAYILNTEYGYKIDKITVVYIIRNLKRIVPFDLPTNSELAKTFLDRALILQSSLENEIVPDTIGSDKEQCKYCSYKIYCKEDVVKPTQPVKKKIVSKPKNKTVFLI
jgi:CRISPR/Cas system-associated exonuclease Cas4 (RecB family)